MALVIKPFTFTAGQTIVGSDHNSNYDTIYNDYNGNITIANFAPTLSLTDSYLTQIATAGKVSGAALTSLTVIPSAAGIIPVANLGSGSPTSLNFLRGDGAWTTVTGTAATALSGSIIQTVNTKVSAVATGTTQTPWDDSIPENTEGTEFMTLAMTPNNASNFILINVMAMWELSVAGHVTIALHQDSTVNAIAAIAQSNIGGNGNQLTSSLTWFMTAGTTSATTFKVRLGGSSAGTVTFNGAASARKLGGVAASSITIQEIKQ